MCNTYGDVIQVMKIEENNLDKLPLGVVICCYEHRLPPGYKPIEEVEMKTANEDPPEMDFLEILKLIFGGKHG